MLPLPSGGTVSALAVAQYFYRDHRIDAAARRSIHETIEGAKDIAIDRSDLCWRDWERYSARQDARMKLGGMVGSIKYMGTLTNFLPYLLFGGIPPCREEYVVRLGQDAIAPVCGAARVRSL